MNLASNTKKNKFQKIKPIHFKVHSSQNPLGPNDLTKSPKQPNPDKAAQVFQELFCPPVTSITSAVAYLCYAKNRWIWLLENQEKPFGYIQKQITASGIYCPIKAFQKLWSEGFNISHITFGASNWLILAKQPVDKSESLVDQSLSTTDSFPEELIEQAWKKKKK